MISLKRILIKHHLRASVIDGKYLKVGVLKKIGDKVGVSREYVRQIAKKLKYITPRNKRNKETYPTFICSHCKKKYKAPLGSLWHKKKSKKNFCSPECKVDWCKDNCWVKFRCIICRNISYVRLSRLKINLEHGQNSPRFCGRKCQGRWLGLNYGRGRKKRK